MPTTRTSTSGLKRTWWTARSGLSRSPGPDGALFEYSIPADGIGRRLHFKEAPDFENPLDANRDNVYEVTITVEDSARRHGHEERARDGHERGRGG